MKRRARKSVRLFGMSFDISLLIRCRSSGKKCHLPSRVLPLRAGVVTMILPVEELQHLVR